MYVDQLTFHANHEIFNKLMNQLNTIFKFDMPWTTRQLSFNKFTNLSFKFANKTSKKINN